MLLTLPLALHAVDTTSVELFLAVECPISNRYVPELNRIYSRYQSKGVPFVAHFPEPSIDQARLDRWVREFSIAFPVKLDPGARNAKLAGATLTPEAAVRHAGKLIYRGRIDNRYVSWGKSRPEPSRRDLIEVLDLLLAGKSPAPRFTKGFGCFIENGKGN